MQDFSVLRMGASSTCPNPTVTFKMLGMRMGSDVHAGAAPAPRLPVHYRDHLMLDMRMGRNFLAEVCLECAEDVRMRARALMLVDMGIQECD
eukprot:1161954-Pelagomonas_calceolata.AAC.11